MQETLQPYPEWETPLLDSPKGTSTITYRNLILFEKVT